MNQTSALFLAGIFIGILGNIIATAIWDWGGKNKLTIVQVGLATLATGFLIIIMYLLGSK